MCHVRKYFRSFIITKNLDFNTVLFLPLLDNTGRIRSSTEADLHQVPDLLVLGNTSTGQLSTEANPQPPTNNKQRKMFHRVDHIVSEFGSKFREKTSWLERLTVWKSKSKERNKPERSQNVSKCRQKSWDYWIEVIFLFHCEIYVQYSVSPIDQRSQRSVRTVHGYCCYLLARAFMNILSALLELIYVGHNLHHEKFRLAIVLL